MKIRPPYRPYFITGFILSGWLFWFVGKIKIPNENVRKWEAIKIPDKDVMRIYFWLELKRKIKQLFKRKDRGKISE